MFKEKHTKGFMPPPDICPPNNTPAITLTGMDIVLINVLSSISPIVKALHTKIAVIHASMATAADME
jgi:hypothetical protein